MRGRLLLGWLPLLLRPRDRLFWPGLMAPLKSRYIFHDIIDSESLPDVRSRMIGTIAAGEKYRRLEAQSQRLVRFRRTTLDGKCDYSNNFF